MATSRGRFWNFIEALYSRELTTDSAKLETPEWIKMPLLPHQKSAIAAAVALEKAKMEGIDVGSIAGDPDGGKFYTSFGILGDRVGSGKSLTALSLVKMPPPTDTYTEYVSRGRSCGDEKDIGLLRSKKQTHTASGLVLTPVSTSLFIVPHALIGQWETYVSRDSKLKALFIKRRNDASAEHFIRDLEKYDAVFVSSTMWNTLRAAHPVRTILWRRFFMDEADSISVSNDVDEIHALFYWFISASWINLIFSYGAYFNVSTYLTPLPDTPEHVKERIKKMQASGSAVSITGCRHVNLARKMCGISYSSNYLAVNAAISQSSRIIIHSSEDYIKESFSTPNIVHRNIICATPQNIRVLDSFISNDMMERLNAGDVAGALDMLGMSAHTESEIADAVTDNLKKELENAKRTYDYKKGLEYSADSVKTKALEVCEQKIASIESRITAIQDRIKRASEQTCPICYCDVTSPAVTPCCQQLFCFGCLCESLKRVAACPLCRSRIDDMKLINVVGKTETSVAPHIISAKKLDKRNAFLEYLRTNKDAKILMFSGYDASFTGIEATLTTEGITHATVNGSQARITKLLRDFKDGKYNVLFLNARNMGAGLNIESATHVVLYHKMSTELENQIVGRAVRLGRSAALDVIHLLHENEVGNTITHI